MPASFPRSIVALAGLLLFSTSLVAFSAPPAPRWWKGNLHTHSLWSDGNDFPEMITAWYRDHGYQFLAISDHNVLSEGARWMKETEITQRSSPATIEKYLNRYGVDWVESRSTADGGREFRLKPISEYRALVEEHDAFLLIPSEEITDQAEGVPVHLNATNIEKAIAPLGGATVRDAIEANVRAVQDQAQRSGREILVHLNHPNYGFAITAEDLAMVLSERFFEVYNGHPGVRVLGDAQHPSVERLWDIANTIRVDRLHAPPLYGIATDDAHDYHGMPDSSRPGRGWTFVRAQRLTPESLIRAIRQGEMYASSGVTLENVRFDESLGTLELEIALDGDAEFTTRFIGTNEDYDRASQPISLAADEKSPLPRLSRSYSADVGQILAEATGTRPQYRLTGKELYVRAVVTSSLAPLDPSFEGQKKQAWTQPVGWRRRVTTP